MIDVKNIDESIYIAILNTIFLNKKEERDLALDRYRKADEMMNDENHFMILGKNASIYLEIAAATTDSLILLSKDIKSIVFKNTDPNAGTSGNNDELIKRISEEVKKNKSEKSSTDLDEDL